jgi:choice-of-anchor B domain-containing protein
MATPDGSYGPEPRWAVTFCGHYAYQSNYAAGLQVLDITDPRNPKEAAYFDTYPDNDNTGFVGTWSNYPYFESGLIAVSNISEGLFIVRHRPT